MRLMSEHARKCAVPRKLHGDSGEAIRQYVEAASIYTLCSIMKVRPPLRGSRFSGSNIVRTG